MLYSTHSGHIYVLESSWLAAIPHTGCTYDDIVDIDRLYYLRALRSEE